MKIKIFLILILTLAVSGCVRNNVVKLSEGNFVTINGKAFSVEIADTPELQMKGLSNHPMINDGQGMLFVFQDKNIRNFWMKEMNFPIDIIWINDDRIIGISENLKPEGQRPLNTYSSSQPVNYVLEIGSGLAAKNNIKVGDKVIYDKTR